MNISELMYQESIKNMRTYFSTFKSKFPNYEDRESQKKMIHGALLAYKINKHAVIEAPTGTGKSIAYILPFLSIWEQFKNDSIYDFFDNDEETREVILDNNLFVSKEDLKEGEDDKILTPKLIIATNTIALQEQLLKKDIPFLKETLELNELNVALAKGRGNFVCPVSISEIYSEDIYDMKGLSSMEMVEEWNKIKHHIIEETTVKGKKSFTVINGDRSELPVTVSNPLWNKLACESDACTRNKCSYYNVCPYYKSRAKQFNADILVTNHAMYFADLNLKIETGMNDLILPTHHFIAFDEAHNLEDVATDFFGKEITRHRMRTNVSYIVNKFKRGSFSKYKENEECKTYVDKLEVYATKLMMDIDILLQDVINFVESNTSVRLLPTHSNFIDIKSFCNSLSTFSNMLKSLATNEDLNIEEEDANLIINKAISIEKMRDDLIFIVDVNNPSYAYWIESPLLEHRDYHVKLISCPIDVSPILQEHLFSMNSGIILTSATMGSNNLDYITSRLGVDKNQYIGAMFRSPFNFEEQSRLYVPQKTIAPTDSNFEGYVTEEIYKIIDKSKGRTLVLFTSYKLMNDVHETLKDPISSLGYNVFKQGELPRTPLINSFKEDISSVLFATSSYWEGIDVPGESLSTVIITRLPFEVPDRPVILSRMEKIEQNGGSSFFDFSVPNAIVKFKQGVGRLIRTTSDKGVVAILDERLLTKSYGKLFIQSLPNMPITRNIDDIGSIL